MGSLQGKTAIVTGGASGIGRASALLLAREGAAVVVADLNEAGGQAVVDEIKDLGRKALFVRCDVSQSADCRQAVEETITAFGSLDILFNNAGIIRRADVLETTEAEWDQVMGVNVKSIFLMSKYAIPHMAAGSGGSIINTGSGWGLVGGEDAVSYCASKGAVVNMTRAMAIDHGPQNIRVNCICPGDTDTQMLRNEAHQLGKADESFLAEAAERPLQRIGIPEDIAQAVLYFAGDASAWTTGAVLVVDGGGLAG
jgi:NAD(P)-dependent dehydrogenase (short-subunit alcohol dehydrogenase family)